MYLTIIFIIQVHSVYSTTIWAQPIIRIGPVQVEIIGGWDTVAPFYAPHNVKLINLTFQFRYEGRN